jgi:CHAT domain-containing protein
MTTDPNDGRIDPETLAAYLDGRLSATERAAVEAKLASDDDSYELLVEVMRTQDALPEPQVQSGRRWWWAAGAVAAAAAVVLAVRLGPTSSPAASPDERISVLIAAVNGERYVAPRLTGGFPSGPIRSATRSASPDPSNRGTADLSSQNLALLAAVGEAQKRSLADPNAANLHAEGVGLVLLGSLDQAIDTLESASANAPENSAILSDLAAAYAARAASAQSARDWSNALDRSERALRMNPALTEAAFNRALALESLNLDGALVAWRTYLDLDRSSAWADEARDRLAKLSAKPQGSRRRENEAAIRAALEGTDDAALQQAVRNDPQRSREWIEEDLAREWAAAVIANDRNREIRARDAARRLIAAYEGVARDALPRDAMQAMWARAADRVMVARAVEQFVDAAQLVREDRLGDASALAQKARPALESTGNPLAQWARYFVALDHSLQQSRVAEAKAELDRIQAAIDSAKYPALAGTVRNRRAVILSRQGDQEGANRERAAAIPLFEQASDVDQVAVVQSLMAESFRLLGDYPAAWNRHREALSRLAATPNYRSRHIVLVQAGLTAMRDGQYDAASDFQRQVIENGQAWQRASVTASGLFQLARSLLRAGRLDDADAAIRDARAMVASVTDASFRERLELDLMEIEGEVFGSRTPDAGLPVLSQAIDGFAKHGFPVRLANLLLWRGRLYVRGGDAAAAEGDWQRAITSLEAERATVSSELLRLTQAGSLRALHTEIALQRARLGRPAVESLTPLEHGRARTLVEHALATELPSFQYSDIQHQLDPHTAIVHYAIGDAEAVAWVTTRARVTSTTLPVRPSDLGILVDRHRRLSSRGAAAAQLASARALYQALITPIASSIGDATTLVVIPDPALAGIAFGALNNPATGAYLIESSSVANAPSAALLASRSSAVPRDGVLLVAADRPEGMAALPWVKSEIEQLGAVYPGATILSGSDATRDRLLASAPRAGLIHFAGHSFGNPANPLQSRLVLHRAASGRGDLYAYEMPLLNVDGTVVVLAACQTGFAAVDVSDDDGVLAMARPFLARGAKAVLATNRDVSDSGAPALMEQFHKRLKSGLTPPAAWQRTAIDAIRRGDQSKEWTAYVVLLGRGSLTDAPGRQWTDDMSGGR